MIFSLDVRRARKGDCMFLHFGTKKKPGLVLIDGGPGGVYGLHLKPRIEEIRQKRKLSKDEALFIDLLMVSHVDDDHIEGILDLSREMIERQEARKPPHVRFGGIWHNSFDEIIDNESHKITSAVTESFGPAANSGELPPEATVDAAEDEDVIIANLKVLSSIPQGFRLRSDTKRLQIPPNVGFDGKLVMAKENGQPVGIGQDLTFTVVGPMAKELEALRKKHNEWLKKLERDGMSAEGALAAYMDKSVPNLSSIVVLATAGHKRMLLTGDARGDKILQGLELTGLLEKGGSLHVDLLKVPHHGSANNLDTDFFQRIIADHYVFSGNGEHGNPERAALEMLLEARPSDEDYEIHLTYPIAEIDVERKKDWAKEQMKEKNKAKTTRPDWSPKKHSLAALFTAHPDFANKVRIVLADKAHVIDLADPL